jgi:adenine phosphoribosyltransferase
MNTLRHISVSFLLFSCAALHGETLRVLIASQCPQKIASIQKEFSERFCNDTIELISCKSSSSIPEQPVGYECALRGARNRIASVSTDLIADADYVVSIENYIEPSARQEFWNDIGLVLIKHQRTNQERITLSPATLIPVEYVSAAQAKAGSEGISADGYAVSIGQTIHDSFAPRVIDPQDWHKESEFGGISRQELLEQAIFKGLSFDAIEQLKTHINYYPDFPKPGILFADFLPILKDAQAFSLCIDLLAQRYKGRNIEVIVGLESRGFILGAALAHKLGVGFVPVRKPGKLPGATHAVTYKKEYGTDTLVIAQGAFKKDQRVLIIDDLIATGGSARAAIELVQLAGGNPVEFVTLLHVPQLIDFAHLNIQSFNLID